MMPDRGPLTHRPESDAGRGRETAAPGTSLDRQPPGPVGDRPAWTLPLLLAGALGILSGCRLVVGTAAVAVGAVGLVGYGIYKTGETAVTGVASVVPGGSQGGGSVVFIDGEFKATFNTTVEQLWLVSAGALKTHGFEAVSGNRDASSGRVAALTPDGERVTLKLDAVGQGRTALRVRVGEGGNIRKSEAVYRLIVDEFVRQRTTQGQGGT